MSIAAEQRRPPPNRAAKGLTGRLITGLRRIADLQVATVVADLAPWLAARRGALLEVGCGDRPYRGLVPAGCRYQGLDWQGADDGFGMTRDPEVTTYDGTVFPFANASQDAVFHTEVLEHVWDSRLFLSECRRVLRPGGEMLLTVPFQARYHFIPHDFWRFTPSTLERLLAEAGFVDISVRPRGSDVTVAFYKLAAVPFRWAGRGTLPGLLAAMLAAPLVVLALAVAHASLRWRWGSPDDCLGYTVIAKASGGT